MVEINPPKKAGRIKMVVGLGNPGDEYIDTRHNTGFKVIDLLAEALNIEVRKKKFGARFGTGESVNGGKLILLKPWKWMNLSGQAVARAVGFYGLEMSNLLVVTDDMALEPGRIRIRARGSAGGHNGLADIIEKLGTDDFGRLRIGIGSPPRRVKETAAGYVLDRPTEPESDLLSQAVQKARDAVLCWIEHGIDNAMNKFNQAP